MRLVTHYPEEWAVLVPGDVKHYRTYRADLVMLHDMVTIHDEHGNDIVTGVVTGRTFPTDGVPTLHVEVKTVETIYEDGGRA
jgi:hypothetical protein